MSMNAIQISDVYENDVEEFLKFAEQHGTALIGKYYSPLLLLLLSNIMYYDNILDFTFSFISWDMVLYILNKFLIDQYKI